jgi:hypothetical protein
VGHNRTLRARDAGRADHLSLHAGPGVRERHRFYPELFWAAACAYRCLRRLRSDLSAAESLYGLSIPRRAIRSEDATTGRILVSCATRHRGWNHDLRAGDCSLRFTRMALGSDHLARRRAGHCLHGRGRDEDCKHHPALPDDCDFGRNGDCICSRGLSAIARSVV